MLLQNYSEQRKGSIEAESRVNSLIGTGQIMPLTARADDITRATNTAIFGIV